ncbi:cell filamentation protein Fic [Kytococcus sp. CUA-901]|nr:cell filamentation protein Fic [Kytococcus sp. CUA-901]
MTSWEEAHWEPSMANLPRRERRSGTYRRFLPAELLGAPLVLDPEVDVLLARAETAVRKVAGSSRDLAGIARFLLRSEAIASSKIEGIAPATGKVALAELGQGDDAIKGYSDQARLVANNMTVVRHATGRLIESEVVTVDDIVDLHRALLPDEGRHHGLRTQQNWIGGSDFHPLEAAFVPPAPERVPDLMEDLTRYLSGASHAPLVQAALVHAQFETIHPFTDGNGRVGRALIHTVLARRGLTEQAVLPISLVLATRRDDYIRGLGDFRGLGPARESGATAGPARWVSTFAEAAIAASEQAARIAAELGELREQWERQLAESRRAGGAQRALRRDSASARILADLPGIPALTPRTVREMYGISPGATRTALDDLTAAGILVERAAGPGVRVHMADDVLDLVTWAERRLASPGFDTLTSPPDRGGLPARPV